MSSWEPSFKHLQYGRNCKRSQHSCACNHTSGCMGPQPPDYAWFCLCCVSSLKGCRWRSVSSDRLSLWRALWELSSVLWALRLTALCPRVFCSLCQGFPVWRGSALWQRDTLLSWQRARAAGPEMEHDLLLTPCRCCRLWGPEWKDEDRVVPSEMF